MPNTGWKWPISLWFNLYNSLDSIALFVVFFFSNLDPFSFPNYFDNYDFSNVLAKLKRREIKKAEHKKEMNQSNCCTH